jgi:type III pantothenate kinase
MSDTNNKLLVIDVGNTNTVLGVFKETALLAQWRLTTNRAQTADEYGILIRNLFSLEGIRAEDISGIMIASVVPPLNTLLEEMAEKYFHLKALFLGPGVRTGIAIHYENPQDVGADRIANGVAAFEKYGGPCVIVDFGTAITFDVISEKGEYLGGVIAPGIGISSEALFQRAARLQRVEIREPQRVIGTNTVASMQSGLFYGAVGLVDGILDRLIQELGKETKVIATGGQAPLVATASKYKPPVDSALTLDGLRIIYERNRENRSQKSGARSQK